MQIGVAGLGRDGRRDRGAADGSRPHGDGVESHARQRQDRWPRRAPRWQRSPADLAKRSRGDHHDADRRGCDRRTFTTDRDGLLAGDVNGKLFIEMSTVPPEVQIALAKGARKRRGVSSNARSAARPARRGRASCSASWAPSACDAAARAKPILGSALPAARACGPVGTGSSAKLTINLPLMVSWQAYGEAFAIARRSGGSRSGCSICSSIPMAPTTP